MKNKERKEEKMDKGKEWERKINEKDNERKREMR